MGNCCGVLGEMKNLIPWESHCSLPFRLSSPRRNHVCHLMSHTRFIVLLELSAGVKCCPLELSELGALVGRWSGEPGWTGSLLSGFKNQRYFGDSHNSIIFHLGTSVSESKEDKGLD